MQITYGGRRNHLDAPSSVIWRTSPIKNEVTGIIPVEMSKEDINHSVKSFWKAPGRAKQSGFSGVEIHAVHGYFLSQFLCPH